MTTTKTKAAPPLSARERALARTRPTLTMTICDDPEVKLALESARYALRRVKAEAADHPGDAEYAAAVTRAEQDVQQAQEAFDAVAIVLRFEALPRPAFEALKKAHPPTEAQAEDGFEVNIETLAPELIATASLDDLTVDDARTFLDTWAEGEAALLFSTAWQVQGETRADVGKG